MSEHRKRDFERATTEALRDDELDAASGGVGGWAILAHTGGVNLHAVPAVQLQLRRLPPSPC